MYGCRVGGRGLCLISESSHLMRCAQSDQSCDHVILRKPNQSIDFLRLVSPMSTPEQDSDSCDTLPPARLPPLPSPISFPPRRPSSSVSPPPVLSQPNSRKLCVRHQRIADEGTNLKLQQVRSLIFSPFSSRPCLSSPTSHLTLPPFLSSRVVIQPPSSAHYITTIS